MESKVSKSREFGGSIPVENVQQLASNNLLHIPLRYIRPELESDHVSVDKSIQIPVIDMSKLVDGSNTELDKLHFACKDWGFFQLINHGVAEDVMEKMKVDIEEFFKLPLEEKMVYAQPLNSIEGYGQAFVVSEDQKLDWGDMLFLIVQSLSQRNLKLWPISPSSFRISLDKYSTELQRVTMCLLRSLAKNLGLEMDTLANKFEDGTQGVRMNYYPPCVQANKVIGLAPHSDATGLTLLIQVNEVQGLQIRRNGQWLPIKPVPGAFIVNVGDVIEILSNGEYKSIEHRAVVNPEKERLSVAAFHSPNMKTTIGPLPELIKEKKANYRSITHEEYVTLVVKSKLDGKGLLEHMKLVTN